MAHRHHRRRTALASGLAALVFVVVMWLFWVGRGEYVEWRVDHHMPLIREYAASTGLPVSLVRAVVLIESSGRPAVRSERDAVGLMQITPITLTDVLQRNPEIPKGDLTDPAYNVRIGTTYLAYLLKRFDQDERLALAAYHMGPTAIARARRQHPKLSSEALIKRVAGPKTRAYVANVLRERDAWQDPQTP